MGIQAGWPVNAAGEIVVEGQGSEVTGSIVEEYVSTGSGGGILFQKDFMRNIANTILSNIPVTTLASTDTPIVTLSAENAATSMPTGVLVSENKVWQYPATGSSAFNPALIIDNSPEGSVGSYNRAMLSYILCTDSPMVEIAYRPDGVANSSCRVKVNGVTVSTILLGTSFTNNTKRIKIDFSGNRKLRNIEIEGLFVPVDSFKVEPTASIVPQKITTPSIAIIGDSFVEGIGTTTPLIGLSKLIPQNLNLKRSLISGLGGTGYSGTSVGTRKRLKNRFVTDIVPFSPDLLVFCMGVNDSAGDYTSLYNDAKDCFALSQKHMPNSLNIVFTGFNPRSSAPAFVSQAISDAASTFKNFVVINTYTYAQIFGTGKVGATTGVGNSDWVTSTDGTHPSVEGHVYLADWMTQKIVNTLQDIVNKK